MARSSRSTYVAVDDVALMETILGSDERQRHSVVDRNRVGSLAGVVAAAGQRAGLDVTDAQRSPSRFHSTNSAGSTQRATGR